MVDLNVDSRRDGNSISIFETLIINNIIYDNKYSSFLEIGTYAGWVSFKIYNSIVERKNGHIDSVDYIPDKNQNYGFGYSPEIDSMWNRANMIKRYNSNKKIIKENNLKNITLHIHGSDAFFEKNLKTYDCILIHGSHTTTQVTKDLKNAWRFLNHGGMILIHPYIVDIEPTNVKKVFETFECNNCIKKVIATDYRSFGMIQKI